MLRETIIKKYKRILVDIINRIDIHKLGRRRRFCLDFYIDNIFRIFFFGETWETFKCELCDRSTIRKTFYKWRDLSIFDMAYNILFNKYKKESHYKNLFIDSTIIENVNCSSLVNYYYKIKPKKQIKISILCDKNRIPLCHEITSPTVHDSRLIPILISKVPLNHHKKYNIIGDKGYIIKRKVWKNRHHTFNIIFPYRKNQIRNNSMYEKKLLNKRYIVEHTFSQLKRTYKRLKLLYDRSPQNIETFLTMAITCQIIRNMEK